MSEETGTILKYTLYRSVIYIYEHDSDSLGSISIYIFIVMLRMLNKKNAECLDKRNTFTTVEFTNKIPIFLQQQKYNLTKE